MLKKIEGLVLLLILALVTLISFENQPVSAAEIESKENVLRAMRKSSEYFRNTLA
ncbi:MAG TPA: pectic acid lyase, partial [Planctomycetaceae bacterium]|nr:pectic acid lyase [Planctomycetaceae bacterium]